MFKKNKEAQLPTDLAKINRNNKQNCLRFNASSVTSPFLNSLLQKISLSSNPQDMITSSVPSEGGVNCNSMIYETICSASRNNSGKPALALTEIAINYSTK